MNQIFLATKQNIVWRIKLFGNSISWVKSIFRNKILIKTQPIFRIWRWRAGGYSPHGHSRKTAFKPIANFLWCRSRTFRSESTRCKESSFVELNAQDVGVRYCLRWWYGRGAAIRVFLYFVVGCTTSFDLFPEKSTQVWIRPFLQMF